MKLRQLGRIGGPAAGLAVLLVSYLSQPSLSSAALVAAVATTMAVLWITEAIPLAVTALFPLFLFPLLGVCSTEQAALGYAAPPIFLFMGGFMLARLVEVTGLHRRLAISVIVAMGDRPKRLVLGFMVTAAFLSMWISNTATTLVLLPVVLAVAKPAAESPSGAAKPFVTALLLGTAYGASIGGVATPIGSPPNIIFLAQLEVSYPDLTISFARWMMFGLPLVAVFLPCAWWWLTRSLDPATLPGINRAALEQQRIKLGPMTTDEIIAALLFATAALGWMFRKSITVGPLTIPGWSDYVAGSGMLHDAVVAIAVVVCAFFLPSFNRSGQRLLTWTDARQISWGLLLLFGGGISLAKGFTASGLSQSLGELFGALAGAPVVLVVLVIAAVVIFLTEITSNTATTSVMMPILAALAVALALSPLQVMLPAAIVASFAFMLPVATPPNAVVFSSGQVELRDMLRAGLFLNLVGILVVAAMVLLLAPLVLS